MVKIRVIEKATGKQIGKDEMNKESYDWHLNIAKCFDFLADNREYVYGKFSLSKNNIMIQDGSDEKVFEVEEYKMLLRNTDPEKQFDDEANSRWISCSSQ